MFNSKVFKQFTRNCKELKDSSDEEFIRSIFVMLPAKSWKQDVSNHQEFSVPESVRGNQIVLNVTFNKQLHRIEEEDYQLDCRITSPWIPAMRKALFKMAEISDVQVPLEEHQYAVDSNRWEETFPKPESVPDKNADTLLKLLFESKEPLLVVLALAQQACVRLRSNPSHMRKLRELMIAICTSGEMTLKTHKPKDLRVGLYNLGLILAERLSYDYPTDPTLHHIQATLTDEEIPRVHGVWRRLWHMVCALGFRPEEERLESHDLLPLLEREVFRAANVGLSRLFQPGQDIDVDSVAEDKIVPPVTTIEDALLCTTCWSTYTRTNPPVTFGDGVSVCRRCVEKKRQQLLQSEHILRIVDFDGTEADFLGNLFGSSTDLALGRAVEEISKARQQLKDGGAQSGVDSEVTTQLLNRAGGKFYYEQGSWNKAEEIYNQAIEMDPSSPVNYSNRAAVRTKMKKLDDAYLDVKRAVRLSNGRWSKAHFGIFQKWTALKPKKGSRKGSLRLDEEEMTEEAYLQEIVNRKSRNRSSRSLDWWSTSVERENAIEAIASLVRAYSMGLRVEHTFRRNLVDFLLVDCARFDSIVNSSESPQVIHNQLAELRESSLLLALVRELLECRRLIKVIHDDSLDTPELHRFKEGLSNRELLESQTRTALESTRNDVDCTLCYSLLCQPVTMPCGHSFCRACAHRALDHSSFNGEATCPVCRHSLDTFIEALATLHPFTIDINSEIKPCGLPLDHMKTNRALDALLRLVFPEEYQTRLDQIAKEEAVISPLEMTEEERSDPQVICIPLFGISVSPDTAGIHQSYMVEDPADRLMVRRMVAEMGEYSRRMKAKTLLVDPKKRVCQFGLFMVNDDPDDLESISGVMAEIDEIEPVTGNVLNLLVHCHGFARFKVLHRENRDGYLIAKVRLMENSYKDMLPKDVSVQQWKNQFATKEEMETAIETARNNFYRDVKLEMLIVAAENLLSDINEENPVSETLGLELGDLHPAGYPFYLMRMHKMSNRLISYLMFSKDTAMSLHRQLRLALLKVEHLDEVVQRDYPDYESFRFPHVRRAEQDHVYETMDDDLD